MVDIDGSACVYGDGIAFTRFQCPSRSLCIVTALLRRESFPWDSLSFAWSSGGPHNASSWYGCPAVSHGVGVCVLVFLLSFLRGTCSSTG